MTCWIELGELIVFYKVGKFYHEMEGKQILSWNGEEANLNGKILWKKIHISREEGEGVPPPY